MIWLAKNFSKCNDFCLRKLSDSHLNNQAGEKENDNGFGKGKSR